MVPTPEVERNQRNFRALLQAMSRPGTLGRLQIVDLPAPIWAVAHCLLDHEVSCCTLAAAHGAPQPTELAAATGARQVPLADADFVFVRVGDASAAIQSAKRGRLESPEEAATLVLEVNPRPATASERLRVRLSGPGIAEADGIAPEMAGIGLAELRALARVNADYPLGVDAIFIGPAGELMCLPRSTRIRLR